MIKKTWFLCLVTCKLVAADLASDWVIESGPIDPSDYFGVTTANGMVGVLSSPSPMKSQHVILNGVYDSYGRGRVSNILSTFNSTDIDLEINGNRIKEDQITNHLQILDMKKAVLTSTFDVKDQLSVSYSIRALRHLPFTTLAQVKLTAKEDLEITPISYMEAPAHLFDVRNFYSEVDSPHAVLPLLSSIAKSPSGKHSVAASSSLIFSEEKGNEPRLVHSEHDQNRHSLKFNKFLKAGETYTFSIVSSYTSSKQYQDPLNEAERLSLYAALQKATQLIQQHEAEWEELWKSDIVIRRDLQIQKEVRLALYHLYSFIRKNSRCSISPMGLSGTGFNGHLFWDAELWMFPALLVLQPELAKSMLDYRFDRLEAAKQNAQAHGYKGAMFPWESADSGAEETPVWALTGPFQHHITACIGWACWKYYQATKDVRWLEEKGYPILKQVADFWTSRVERNAANGTCEINNVIGANEWLENVDNNAFTNAAAISVLKYATQAACELGIAPDPDWECVANQIPLLHFPDGTTRENSTYNGEIIKQADVNLLAYPLELITDHSQIEKDLSYYEPRLSPDGPAMGYAMLSVLYARLGNPNKAHALFLQSYQPNRKKPFGVFSEMPQSKNPYFTTAAGGMLQALLFGFGGLSITDEGVVQQPLRLPSVWQSVEISLPKVSIELKNYGIQ
jgi:trehalose/maltose hydrolase-like predicted phosphorylase